MSEKRYRRADLGKWILIAFVLYCLLLPVANYAYAPEGNPALGGYLAIRVLGLSVAVSALGFVRSRQSVRKDSKSQP